MMPDFLPRKDADFLAWTANFRTVVSADAEKYGLVPSDVAEFEEQQSQFAAAYRLTQGNSTRTPSGIVDKDTKRAELTALTRALARIIRGQRGLTPADLQKAGLGRSDPSRAIVPPPFSKPVVQLQSLDANRVAVRLTDSESVYRSCKPKDVASAHIYLATGDTFPSDAGEWRFHMSTARTKFTIEFDAENPPGTRVWVVACWVNARQKQGPMGKAVALRLAFGGVQSRQNLRVAA